MDIKGFFFKRKKEEYEENYEKDYEEASQKINPVKKGNKRQKNAITIFAEQDITTIIGGILKKYDINLSDKDYFCINEAEKVLDQVELVLLSDNVVTSEEELFEEIEKLLKEHKNLRIAVFFTKPEFISDSEVRKRLRVKFREIGVLDVFFPDLEGNTDFNFIGEILQKPSSLEIEEEREKISKEKDELKKAKEASDKKILDLQKMYQEKEKELDTIVNKKIDETILQENEKKAIEIEKLTKEYEGKLADVRAELLKVNTEAQKLSQEKEERIKGSENLAKEIERLTAENERMQKTISENKALLENNQKVAEVEGISIDIIQNKIDNSADENEKSKLLNELAEKEKELEKTKENIKSLENKNKEDNEKFAGALSEIEELKKALESEREKAKVTDKSTKENEEKTSVLTQKIEELENEYQNKIAFLKENLKKAEDDKLKEIEKIKNEAYEELRLKEKEIVQKESELENLTKEKENYDETIKHLKRELNASKNFTQGAKQIGVFNVSQGAGATITSLMIYFMLMERKKSAAIIGRDFESVRQYMDEEDIYEYAHENDITRLISLAKRNGKEYIIIDFGTIINLDSAGDKKADERLSDRQGMFDELARLDLKIGLAHTGDTQIHKLKFWNNIADRSYIFYLYDYNKAMGFLSEKELEKMLKELEIEVRSRKKIMDDLAGLLFNMQMSQMQEKQKKKSLPKLLGL